MPARTVALAIFLVLALSAPLRAAGNLPPIHSDLAGLPAEATLVVAVTDAAMSRRGAMGREFGELAQRLVGVGEFDAVARAWRGLATRLRLEPERAFDDLLGHRVIYLRSGESWALLATIDRATEARIRNALKPAPRQPFKGAQVLALEEGSFVMSVLPVEGERDTVTLVLAPDENRELFLSVIDPNRKTRPFRKTRAAKQLRELHPSPVMLVAWRDETRDVSVVGFPNANRLEFAFMAHVEGTDNAEMPIPWSRARLDEIARGANAAVLELDTAAYAKLSRIDALFDPAAEFKAMFDGDRFIGSRRAMRMAATDNAPMSVAVGIETTDPGRMILAADSFMARFIATTGVAGLGIDPDGLDLRGVAPDSVRTVPRAGAADGPAAAMLGEGPDFSWCVTRPDENNEIAWWITGTDPESVDSLRSGLSAKIERPADERPWIILAEFRPERIAQSFIPLSVLMKAADPQVAGFFEFAQRVEHVSVSAYHTDPSTIRGDAELRFKAAAAKPAAR